MLSVTMKAKCINCGQEFEAERASARFCSAKCRVSASRGIKPEEEEVKPEELNLNVASVETKEVDVTKEPEELTENGYYLGQKLTNRVIEGKSYPDRVVGYCRKCNEPINRKENPLWDLIEVCHSCVIKGVKKRA